MSRELIQETCVEALKESCVLLVGAIGITTNEAVRDQLVCRLWWHRMLAGAAIAVLVERDPVAAYAKHLAGVES